MTVGSFPAPNRTTTTTRITIICGMLKKSMATS
jgi:hypothetical protein